MSIPITDKFKPKGTGGFALVDAADVEMPDGSRLSDFKGGSVSWDDITGKPFGEEVVYYAWDKDTEYETSIDASPNQFATKVVKLSDESQDSSFFFGKTFSCSAINNGEDMKIYTTITEDHIVQLAEEIYVVLESAIVVTADSAVYGDVTLTRGVWAIGGYLETSPIQFLWWKILDPVTQLDESFIPDTIARVSDIPTDEQINALIDAKLGVIENGSY